MTLTTPGHVEDRDFHEKRDLHAAERLLNRIDQLQTPVCVGLDPVFERLPESLRSTVDVKNPTEVVSALKEFCEGIMVAVAGIVPCIKIQSACFERFRHLGVEALHELMHTADGHDLEVILDGKRGDIGISAEHYAFAAFGGVARDSRQPGWVTVNSYLGADGITPFLRESHGAFALVRTSNPSGDAIQELRLEDGRTVAEAVAAEIARIGDSHVGERGYSSLGAVVGATKPEAAAKLRELMPRQLFLVPGFGAQGGSADDVKPCFRTDGTGAIITASRSVIYAYEVDQADWTCAVKDAAQRLADQVGEIAGLR